MCKRLECTVAKFLVPDGGVGGIVDSGIGLSHRPTRLHRPVGRYDKQYFLIWSFKESRFDQAIILMNYEKNKPFLHMTSKSREDNFSCGRMFPVIIDPDKWDHRGQKLDERL